VTRVDQENQQRQPVPASALDEWTHGLAHSVGELWRREEDHRRVHDPVALPVRWHAAGDDIADHWANARRDPAGATAGALTVAGSIEQVADVYRRIPSGRLVILGKAGAGKTVLAARLALDLLATRQPDQPVPVIVSVGSWNPATTPLTTWLAGLLARDHPGLAAPAGPRGPTRATALIAAGRILPILDGFDEIHPELHQAAMDHLNTTPDTPVVLTSRPQDYTTAVAGTDVLTAAAVIELEDLTLDDLADYLPRTAAGPRTGLWGPVLTRMRHSTAPGPATLRHVLTNPLMVFLARTIYSDTPGHDPTDLLDPNRLPTVAALQEHLLAAFIPAVYHPHRPSPPRWDPERAYRYLTYLAGHLHRVGTQDLAWWQLRNSIPRTTRTLVLPLAFGLVFGLAFGLVGGLVGGLVVGPLVGLAGGLVGGFRGGFAGKGPGPTRTRLQIRGRPLHIGRLAVAPAVGLTAGLADGFVGGPVFGSTGGFVDKFVGGFVGGFAFSLTLELIVGTATGLTFGLDAPTSASDVVSVSESLAADRRNTIRKTLTLWLAFWLTIGLEGVLVLAGRSVVEDAGRYVVTLAVGLLFGLTFYGPARTAWGQWLILVRVWLPLTGRLPWPVHAFLTDAYHRGVLRQTGAVYQFRHARLQEHLTSDQPTGSP
jgi:hypothetical protein